MKNTTLAREIWKRMDIGKVYSTRDLFRLLSEAEYYDFIPIELQGKNVNKIVADEMWKVVKAGYARTYIQEESLPNLRGVRFDTEPDSYTTYKIRYWVRLK